MSKSSKLKIGLPSLKQAGGPKIFLRRLRDSIEENALGETCHFFNPFHNVDLFTSLARDYYGKPYVLRVDGIYLDGNEISGGHHSRNESIFKSIKRSIGVIFQSKFNKTLVEIYMGQTERPNRVIPNGVCLRTFSSSGNNYRSYLGIGKKDRVLLTSAYWRAHKRLKDVLRIYLELNKNHSIPHHLIILGEPDTQIPNCSRIHCPGHVSIDDLPAWYRTADCFVFLSWLDHCPNTVIEALACGLPVVCTNQGGTREIVEKTNGGIIVDADAPYHFQPVDLHNPPSPNHGKIMEALNELFSNYETFRHSIKTKAIDIHRIAAEYVLFISDCLKNPSR